MKPFPPPITYQMRQFMDVTRDRPDWQGARGLVFETLSMKVLSSGGTFRIFFVGGKAVKPFTNVHGLSLLDIGSGMWDLTMSRAPIMSFDRSGGMSDVDSLTAAISKADWNSSQGSVLLYPSWREFPAIDAARLPAVMFQVSNP